MTRLLASLALCFGLTLGLLAGCGDNGSSKPAASASGGTTPPAGGTIKILWAKWAPADYLQRLGDEYKAKTGVAIEIDQKPWDASGFPASKQQVFNNDSDTYDIIIGDSQWIGQGVKGKHYLELTDFIKANPELFKDVPPAALRFYAEYPQGSARYYAVPCESDAMAFAYRKDLFEDPTHKAQFAAFLAKNRQPAFELGVPKTWDQLYWIARYFKEASGIPDMAGIVMPTTPGYDQATMSYECMLWAYGGDWGDQAKMTVTVGGPQAIAALELMRQLVALSSIQGNNMDYGEVTQAYSNGKAAMALSFFAFFPALNSPVDDKDYYQKTGYFNVPAGPAGRFTALGGQGLSVVAHIDQARQQRALDFIKWFCQPATQTRWAQLGGYTANKQVLASQTFARAAPYNPLFAEAFGMMRDFWNIPEYDQLLQISQREISRCIQGQESAADACAAMQAEQEKVVARARAATAR